MSLHGPSTAPSGTTPRAWRPWAGLAVLALPTLLLSLDITVLHLAVPHLSADLDPTASQTLWIIDIYGFLLASLLIAMGAVGDRWGRRRLLLVGALAFGAASTAAAFAQTPEALIAARATMGIAGAAIMPSTLSLIASLFPDARQRGTAIGIWAAMFSVGIALGPVLGGVMLEHFWWGSVFLLGVPVMVLLLLAGPRLLPEPATDARVQVRPSSVLLLMGALLAATYALKDAASHGAGAPALLGVVAALVLGTAFVVQQRSASSPLLDLSLFGERRVRATLVSLLVSVGAVGGIYLFVTQFLQLVAGLDPLPAGLSLVPATAVLIATSVLAPSLAARIGAGRVLAGALAISAAGFVALAATSAGSSHWWVVAGFAVVYAGVGPVMALGTDLVVASAPPARAGGAAALSETGSELGISLGVAMLGSLGTAVFAARAGADVDGGLDSLSAVAAQAGRSAEASGAVGVAQAAFVDGMTTASWVAAALLVLAAGVTWRAFSAVRDRA
ncbi:DHA2 family multidrug resistance protein-like MFS transporter [Mumia flava]|uniref:DHA2 family multidrug resistance protein-like MFS transporter n=1 Tax=Mumia flava TaxID=1348852 RepID=A0A2M9BDZ7_9ACTN|nr:MFS transporter [Mumia flava]PJJ56114.1 DHA2 family multidrug resistance protein-like MFS transporter [Mumia flava]